MEMSVSISGICGTRNLRYPGLVRRFLYERKRGIIVVEGDSETDLGEPEVTFTDSALRIIAAYEQGQADPVLDRGAGFHASFALGHTPRYTGFSDLAHRIVDRWFAPAHKNWKWYRRFLFTISGSITFFLFWGMYVNQGFEYLEFNLNSAIFLGILVAGPPWFAGITAWANFRSGPVGFFLSGFLLPYFIWTLVAYMHAKEVPPILGPRDSISDASPAQGTGVLRAPPKLTDRPTSSR